MADNTTSRWHVVMRGEATPTINLCDPPQEECLLSKGDARVALLANLYATHKAFAMHGEPLTAVDAAIESVAAAGGTAVQLDGFTVTLTRHPQHSMVHTAALVVADHRECGRRSPYSFSWRVAHALPTGPIPYAAQGEG